MHKKGFTLIELIVVVIIIGILAAIAAPMMQGMKVRAICTEAATAMGTIRTALRVYRVEFGHYPRAMEGFVSDFDTELTSMGIPSDNLTGAYFSKECYYINIEFWGSGDDQGYVYVYALPAPDMWGGLHNNAVKHDETSAIVDDPYLGGYLRMDCLTGDIRQGGISKSGYPEQQNPEQEHK